MINEVKIEGFITNEVKSFTTNSNMNIKTFTINAKTGKKNSKGGYDYISNFIKVKAFNCATNIKDRDRVIVTGRLVQEVWEGKEDKKKHYDLVVYGSDIQLVSSYQAKEEPKTEKEEDNLIEVVDDEEPIDINEIPF